MNKPVNNDPKRWDGVKRSYIPPQTLTIHPSLPLHTRSEAEVDPVSFEVIRYALMNANIEHSTLLRQLSVSPIVMMTRDFQTSILCEEGDLIYLGPDVQYFSNSHALTVKWILENRAANPGVAQGDMFFTNDPFISAPHQQDSCLACPVFVDGELFCWVANTLHYVDVGGTVPGSFCIGAEDLWWEGPAFPPVKMVEKGRIRADIEEVFVRQSRMRTHVLMDLRAAISANQKVAERLQALVSRYGAEVVKTVMRRTQAAAEALFVERLGHVPDGQWSARGYAAAAVPGDEGVYAYQINLRKEGEHLFVDNQGSDPQTGSINITYIAFSGAVLASLMQMMVPELAGAYGGPYRRVQFAPQSGLLNCAEFPAAVSPSGSVTTELNINIAARAVARMLPCGDEVAQSLVLGATIPQFNGVGFFGTDERDQTFLSLNTDGMMGSLGATPDSDGVDVGGHFWIPNGIGFNVEELEASDPLLILSRRLLPAGRDGAGCTRGGLGFVEAFIPWGVKSGGILASNYPFSAGSGLFGGNPCTRTWTRVLNHSNVHEIFKQGQVPRTVDDLTGEEVALGVKEAGISLDAVAGVVEWSSPTTAGFGDPLLREPERCLQDIRIGLLTEAATSEIYGVIVQGEGDNTLVDIEATAAQRRRLRVQRLGREPGEGSPLPEAARVAGALARLDKRWHCGQCGYELGGVENSPRCGCECRRLTQADISSEFDSRYTEFTVQMEFREFLCPTCGIRIDTEMARKSDSALSDMRLLRQP